MIRTIFELECKLYRLKDVNNNKRKTLLEFRATAVEEKQKNAAFIAGTVASHENTFRIATAVMFDFEPFNHGVSIQGLNYVIVSRQHYTERPLGRQLTKPQKLIILTLGGGG